MIPLKAWKSWFEKGLTQGVPFIYTDSLTHYVTYNVFMCETINSLL